MGQPNTAHAQQVAVGLDWVGWRGEGKEYICDRMHTAQYPAASSKDLSHTTSPPEVESSVEIGTNSPVPVRFLFWCNLQSYIFFGSKALWDKKKKNTRAHLCLLGPSKEYILVD